MPASDPTSRPTRARRRSQAGFTILEAGVAGAIVTLFLGSLFALNSNMMHLLRASAEAANASQSLQQRVEQVRLANWTQLTDPTWVQGTLLGTRTDASVNLPGLTETLTVAPYVPPSSRPLPARRRLSPSHAAPAAPSRSARPPTSTPPSSPNRKCWRST